MTPTRINLHTISGFVMSRDCETVRVENGLAVEIKSPLAPFYFRFRKDLEGWFHDRQIDGHRTNSRLLKKALRLRQNDSAEAVLYCHAASVTDTYWFRQDGEDLSWEDVRYRENYFDLLALHGDPDAFALEPQPTPELTNTGSFEKCWRLEDGEWWMYKRGNDAELFSEFFVSRYCQALGFPAAAYEYTDTPVPSVRTRNFTENGKYCFEDIDPFTDGSDDYETCFRAIGDVSAEYLGDRSVLEKQYLELLIADSVCYNMDRHSHNFGFLRDSETGRVLRLAPNYDNNIALIARGLPNPDRTQDGIIRFFREFLEENEDAQTLAGSIEISWPDADTLQQIAAEIPVHYLNLIGAPADEAADPLIRFILDGQEIVGSLL